MKAYSLGKEPLYVKNRYYCRFMICHLN